MKDLRIVSMLPGSQHGRNDRLRMLLASVAFIAGAGAIASVTPATAGVYATLPTLALSNVGDGSGATFALHMKAVGCTKFAGGSGYAVGDTITTAGGTGTHPIVTVDTVDGGGAVLTAHVTTAGDMTVLPANHVAQGSTSGSGTGATFDLTWGILSVTVSGGGTLYPVSGMTIATSGGTPTTLATFTYTVTSAAGARSLTPIDATTIAGLGGLAELPSGAYNVQVTPDADVTCSVLNKTATGFTLAVAPRLAATTLAAGHADILIHG